MDSTIIKIVNIPLYKNDQDEEPSSYKLVYLPSKIDYSDIIEIHSKVASNGKLFKNVSTIKTTRDEMYDIVGNYKKENDRLFSNIKKIGFVNG